MGIGLLWLAVVSSPLHGGSKVIIITPHVDAIRTEFGRAFAEWHLSKYGDKAEADRFIDQYTTWKEDLHGVIARNIRDQSRYRFRLFKYAALGE